MTDTLLSIIGIGLGMGLVFSPAVLGLMLALRCLDFPDLGIEASVALGAAAAAVSVSGGQSLGLTAVSAIAIGLATGVATSALHVSFRISKLLSGVIILTASYSVILRLMSGPNLSLLGQQTLFDDVGRLPFGVLGTFPVAQVLMLSAIVAVVVVALTVFLRSLPGLRLRLVGLNPVLADDLGIRRRAYIIGGVAAANGAAALSGMLLAMQQGFADASSGTGTLVMTIASLAIGEHLVRRLRPRNQIGYFVSAAVLGSIAYQALIAVALRVGMPASDLKLVTAALVALVVALRRFELNAGSEEARGY